MQQEQAAGAAWPRRGGGGGGPVRQALPGPAAGIESLPGVRVGRVERRRKGLRVQRGCLQLHGRAVGIPLPVRLHSWLSVSAGLAAPMQNQLTGLGPMWSSAGAAASALRAAACSSMAGRQVLCLPPVALPLRWLSMQEAKSDAAVSALSVAACSCRAGL